MSASSSLLGAFLGIVIVVAYPILTKIIVGERKFVHHTSGKKIQIIGLILIGPIAIGCIFFLDILELHVMRWFWLGFVIVLLGFQASLERIFLRETNHFIVSLLVLVISLMYIFIFMF